MMLYCGGINVPHFLNCQGFPTSKPPQCMDALGMESGDIPDSAVTASTSVNADTYAPSIGRLHFLSSGSGKYGSWAAGANDKNQWFQVDFGSWTKVTAVATQGRQDADQWVKNYMLSFSYDGVFYQTVNNEHGTKKVNIYIYIDINMHLFFKDLSTKHLNKLPYFHNKRSQGWIRTYLQK